MLWLSKPLVRDEMTLFLMKVLVVLSIIAIPDTSAYYYPQITDIAQDGDWLITFTTSRQLYRVDIRIWHSDRYKYGYEEIIELTNHKYGRLTYNTYLIPVDPSHIQLDNGKYDMEVIVTTDTTDHVPRRISSPRHSFSIYDHFLFPQITDVQSTSDGDVLITFTYAGPFNQAGIGIFGDKNYNIELTNLKFVRETNISSKLTVDGSQLANGKYGFVVTVASTDRGYSLSKRKYFDLDNAIPRINGYHTNFENAELTIKFSFTEHVYRVAVTMQTLPSFEPGLKQAHVGLRYNKQGLSYNYLGFVNITMLPKGTYIIVLNVTTSLRGKWYSHDRYTLSQPHNFTLYHVANPQIVHTQSSSHELITTFVFARDVYQVGVLIINDWMTTLGKEYTNHNFVTLTNFTYRVDVDISQLADGVYSIGIRVLTSESDLSYQLSPRKNISISRKFADSRYRHTDYDDGSATAETIAIPVACVLFIIGLIIFVSVAIRRPRARLLSEQAERNRNLQHLRSVMGTSPSIQNEPPRGQLVVIPKTYDDDPPSYAEATCTFSAHLAEASLSNAHVHSDIHMGNVTAQPGTSATSLLDPPPYSEATNHPGAEYI